MRLYKRKGVYYVTRQSTGGKQIKRSLKTSDKQIAEQQRAKLELDIHEARIFGKEPARSFKELIVTYLEAKQRTRGFSRLQDACKPLLGHFGASDVTQLQETDVEEYIAYRSEFVSDGAINREVGTLSAAFNYVISKCHWRIENPCTKAELPKEPKGRERFLTYEEAKTLLQVAAAPVDQNGRCLSNQYKSPVLRDFIEVALNTGCRKGELLNLKWENIDFSTRLLHLEQTKSGEWQIVPIKEEARQVLVWRMRLRDEVCHDTPWVFFHITQCRNTEVGDRIKDVKRVMRTACRKTGLTGALFIPFAIPVSLG